MRREERKTGRLRSVIVLAVLLGCITACAGKEKSAGAGTPEEVVNTVMQSIRELDLDTLNAVTDNSTGVIRNWLGWPVRKEYKVFGELLQSENKRDRRYKRNYKIAKAVTENLEWRIKDIRDQERRTEIDLCISNVDMSEAEGRYMIRVMEEMLEDEGTGLHMLAGSIFDLTKWEADELCQYINETEEISTIEVTVIVKREKEGWRLHIDDAFVNAFMGNINSEEIPEELEIQLEELEAEYERRLKQWEEDIMEGAQDWADEWIKSMSGLNQTGKLSQFR